MITGLLNPIEVMQVQIDLEQKGIKYYDMRQGNDCIWVNYGLVNAYYIFRDGKIADVQID
jgi:hypothetical protein